jgi:ABC-type oligopeptide transport system ATPase subunit
MEPTSKEFVTGPHFERHDLVEMKVKKLKKKIEKEKEWSVEFLTHDLRTLRYFYRHTIIVCCENRS